MDNDDIHRLAQYGVAGFSSVQLSTAADWLREFGESSGDGRYFLLADVVAVISELFDAQSGQMFTDTLQDLDAALKRSLPDVLETAGPADATHLARLLRDEVEQILRDDVQRVDQAFRDKLPPTI